jgi:hypothetical protein
MLITSVALTLLLYLIPYGEVLAYPLLLLSTLAHEMGHGLTALLCGGRFEHFAMWPDGSGVAVYSIEPGRIKTALIAAGGLVGPALAAALGFFGARRARTSQLFLQSLALILILLLVLFVRSLFGVVFVAILALFSFVIGRRTSAEVAQLTLIFLSVQLALAVFSRADYLFTAVAQTANGVMPSDVAQMAQALFLPYWFWGGLCGAFSVLILIFGLRAFWR